MIKIDAIKRQVYIKSVSVLAVFRETGKQGEYKYPTGEVSMAILATADMGTNRIRAANLPPEVPNETLRETPASFGNVLDIQAEMCSKTYRYSMENGTWQVMVMLTRHVPPHLTHDGDRVLLSNVGQPATCETGNLYQVCPTRQRSEW